MSNSQIRIIMQNLRIQRKSLAACLASYKALDDDVKVFYPPETPYMVEGFINGIDATIKAYEKSNHISFSTTSDLISEIEEYYDSHLEITEKLVKILP